MPRGPKPMKRKLHQNEFYCVSCRKAVKIPASDICFRNVNSSKRGKIPMLTGYCSKCDCNLNKFVSNKKATNMKNKYKKC